MYEGTPKITNSPKPFEDNNFLLVLMLLHCGFLEKIIVYNPNHGKYMEISVMGYPE